MALMWLPVQMVSNRAQDRRAFVWSCVVWGFTEGLLPSSLMYEWVKRLSKHSIVAYTSWRWQTSSLNPESLRGVNMSKCMEKLLNMFTVILGSTLTGSLNHSWTRWARFQNESVNQIWEPVQWKVLAQKTEQFTSDVVLRWPSLARWFNDLFSCWWFPWWLVVVLMPCQAPWLLSWQLTSSNAIKQQY